MELTELAGETLVRSNEAPKRVDLFLGSLTWWVRTGDSVSGDDIDGLGFWSREDEHGKRRFSSMI